MGAAKGQALNSLPVKASTPTEESAIATLNDVVFLALPGELYKQLSDEAARRQMTLAQLFATAVSNLVQTPPTGER